MLSLALGLVVLGPPLNRDHLADLMDLLLVPGGGHPDNLRENGGMAVATHSVKAFTPIVIIGHIETGNGRGGSHELERLFTKRHSADKVIDAGIHRLIGIGVDDRIGNFRDRGGGASGVILEIVSLDGGDFCVKRSDHKKKEEGN